MKYDLSKKSQIADMLRAAAKWYDTHEATSGFGFPTQAQKDVCYIPDTFPSCGCALGAFTAVSEVNFLTELAAAWDKVHENITIPGIFGDLIPDPVHVWNDNLPGDKWTTIIDTRCCTRSIKFLSKESKAKLQALFRRAAYLIEHGAKLPLSLEEEKAIRYRVNKQKRDKRKAVKRALKSFFQEAK